MFYKVKLLIDLKLLFSLLKKENSNQSYINHLASGIRTQSDRPNKCKCL